ncbi:hydroxymethylbilane synthase [Chrysiogenes arsenatis]|uniref:hydroxymethylbilane synthase n=1 Tax=Chrysiogenes arsenatis TaxID=309797 RepID=UPI0003F86C0F|nr:hydroxymethylbilane synthase [Chrysiogenes arsenatis]
MKKIVIGTRASKLALWQAEHIQACLEKRYPSLEVVLEKITTQGDKILDTPLALVGGKGLFVKELETALLEGTIDLAVHSMKDVPTVFPEGLTLSVITERDDPRDAFVSRTGKTMAEIGPKARIGTSSLRRQAQLLAHYPEWEIVSIRGNVQTRLNKMEELQLDGIILAAAGLRRLELAHLITEYIEPATMIPAIGQGALGIEIRENDSAVAEMIAFLADETTSRCVRAERTLLRTLEGGCQVPIGGYATSDAAGNIALEGIVASLDGQEVIRHSARGNDPEALGNAVAQTLLDNGAREILDVVYNQ